MDYNKLKTFVMVANLGNITKAAHKLYRTQPAITFQIKELEESLGLTLFHRERSKIILTKEGEELYKVAKGALEGLDSFIAELKGTTKSLEGKITIGVVPEYGREILSRRLALFRKNHPGIDVKLIYRPSESLLERLKTNELDCAVIARISSKNDIKIKKILDMDYRLITSPKYFKLMKSKNMNNFLNFELVDFRDDFTLLSPWAKKNKKNLYNKLKHTSPHVVIQDFRGIRNYLVSGSGVAVLPKFTVEEDLKTGRLVEVYKSSPSVKIPLYFIQKNVVQKKPIIHELYRLIIP